MGWVHMAITYADNDYKIYRNGVVIGTSTAFTLASYTSDSRFYVGKRHGNTTGPLNAYIDDARLYSRTLSGSDILKLYQSGQVTRKAVSENGLVGYWPFNEGRGCRQVIHLTPATPEL